MLMADRCRKVNKAGGVTKGCYVEALETWAGASASYKAVGQAFALILRRSSG